VLQHKQFLDNYNDKNGLVGSKDMYHFLNTNTMFIFVSRFGLKACRLMW